MIQVTLNPTSGMLSLRFADGVDATYPLIWLRDNDPADLHPQTQERMSDLLTVPHDIAAKSVTVSGDMLQVIWDDRTSHYSLGWLKNHIPGAPIADPADVEYTIWGKDLAVPHVDAEAVMTQDAALLDWLLQTQRYGLTIVQNINDNVEAGMAIAKRISFLRETNFGTTFEVISKPNPNNLAYTPVALPLHTDLTNQELPPGYQFLHCLVNDAQGGGSIFADGYAMAEELRKTDPEAFDLLTTITVPFRFHDDTCDIRSRKKVINLTDNGRINEICYNAHLADIFDLAPNLMQQYYRAYRAFMILTRNDKFRVTFKLNAGEMAVFDNRRVLHGREAFDPNTGNRHLHGCYVDRGEFESRIRVLSA